MVFSLGLLLLFFICKCAFVLIQEKRKHDVQHIELSELQGSHKRNSNTDCSEDVTDFTGCCSSPFFLSCQPSNFRQGSSHQLGNVETDKDTHNVPQSSSDNHQETPLPGPMSVASGKAQTEVV
ncbi:unnamed protein product [Ilex paraguariensis]